jgi:2-polyprenyl-3-methyl-5-hydroxy-6-metoxy-1,4-benzoquinol methylase
MSTSQDAARVKRYFTRSAVSFDALYSDERMSPVARWVNQRFRRDIYERFVKTIEAAKAVSARSALDVGCGSGRYAIALHENGVNRVVGVDISPAMIELARAVTTHETSSEKAFQFVISDFLSYETTEIFDIVIAMGFFDYTEDPLPFLTRMRRLSRGHVVASFPSHSFYRTPLRRLRYAIKKCPVFFYHPGQIRAIGASVGFAETLVTKIPGAGMDYFVRFTNGDRE